MTEALSFLNVLSEIPGIRVDFIARIPAVPVDAEREEVMRRLRPHHAARVERVFETSEWHTAEQVHDRGVGVVSGSAPSSMVVGVDGLVTGCAGTVLGIYVADCAPIWLVDRRSGAVGLLHSGRRGTELGILGEGLARMNEAFGTRPSDVVGLVGPAIRPPHYEVDFVADIVRQAKAAGVVDFHDSGIDTASDAERYYSYRRERGLTGRMLALIMRDRGT